MANNLERIPEEYRPISMWGYFGYEILFAIPVIGWICLIVFALTAENLNLRNYARSKFCVMIIYIVLFGLAWFFAVTMGVLDSLTSVVR